MVVDIKFDAFKNAKKTTITLVNPDRREIAILETTNTQLTLRFNDLSELSFTVNAYTTNAKGECIKHAFYADIQTKRMVLVEGIGYFVIQSVVEKEDGFNSYKEVQCFSEQYSFKNFGIYMYDRVYKFYDPTDENDSNFNPSDVGSIPSVVGQLVRQLQIDIDPNIKLKLAETPNQYYDEWTISYISPELFYEEGRDDNMLRAFTEARTLFAYDFMVGEVGDKFQTVFDFDFLNHAIKIKLVEQATLPTNIYLTYENVVNELETTEESDDIVTVLNCVGNNLNIQAVNPTGQNYIADFSYYMYDENRDSEKRGAGWMSPELTQKIIEWREEIEDARESWQTEWATGWDKHVLALRELLYDKLALDEKKLYADKKLEGFRTEQNQYTQKLTDQEMTGNEITTAEEVNVDECSLEETSIFYEDTNPFSGNIVLTCYKQQPNFIQDESNPDRKYITGVFSFDGIEDSMSDTIDNCFRDGYIYFLDGDTKTYCKLNGTAIVETDGQGNPITTYKVKSFTRYTIYSNLPVWVGRYNDLVISLQSDIDDKNAQIEELNSLMSAKANELNLQNRFDLSDPEERKLFFELKKYWIEGEYENQGFAVFDTTTPDEEIDLAWQLLRAGEEELSKVSQPRFSIKVNAIDFTKIYEFKAFSSELELGRVITIRKNENVHYKPALTSITLNLDEPDDFTLEFSNVLRGGDWGFQYGELLAKAESTSRQVSSNWQNITAFSRRENAIEQLLYNPLNRTLRLVQGNLSNQEFVIDETGILGRRYADESHSSFSSKQVRIINNMLIFTDDGWQTAKTALGEIHYSDPNGNQSNAYGLSAEVLVGSLILGNTLYIRTDLNDIRLDSSGITIENPNIELEDEHPEYGKAVFHADNEGNVYLKGNIDALSGTIGGLTIAENSISSNNGNFSINAEGYLQTKSGTIGGLTILENSINSDNGNFSIDSNGTMTANAGEIGGISIITRDRAADGTSGLHTKIEEGSDTVDGFLLATAVKDKGQPTQELLTALAFGDITLTAPTTGEIQIIAETLVTRERVQSSLGSFKNIDFTQKCSGPQFSTQTMRAFQILADSSISSITGFYFGVASGNVKYTAALSWWGSMLYLKIYDSDGNLVNLPETKTFEVHYTLIPSATYSWDATVHQGSNGTQKDTGAFIGISSATFDASGATTYSFYIGSTPSSTNIATRGHLIPYGDATYNLGSAAYRWNNIFASTGTIQQSDIQHKTDVEELPYEYSILFDLLRPVRYKFINGTSGRYHIGLIANELKDAIERAGLTTQEVAAYCEEQDENGELVCGIRYDEFIPLIIEEVQCLKKKLNDLTKHKE
jgi:hypothetical protein